MPAVQISADGFNWVDEGTVFDLPAENDAVTFCKVRHFGGWLQNQLERWRRTIRS